MRAKLLRRHVLPAVVGLKGRRYIVDHHQFARALLEEDAGQVAVYVVANLSRLSKRAFWTFLGNSSWCHAYDADGRRRDLADIPKHLGELVDDPYRSLAGALIRSGGCAKSSKPFAEVLWADYLRAHIPTDVTNKNWKDAVATAQLLAHGEDAECLPGWCGPNHSGL